MKELVRKVSRNFGIDIIRFSKDKIGIDPFLDINKFLMNYRNPVIFDIGANVGQSVDRFLDYFPSSTIHSFEPSPKTYQKLKVHCEKFPRVNTWNYGIGSIDTTLEFHENEYSDMSSFLTPSKSCWGNIIGSIHVPVFTLDSFSKNHCIDFVHVLKSDTQGFELDVFKGAKSLMESNKIALIYFEMIFSDMYKNMPSSSEIFRYLIDNNFVLVAFYEQHFQEKLASWTDALFINREFYNRGMN